MTFYSDLCISRWLLQLVEDPQTTAVWKICGNGATYFAEFNEGDALVRVEVGIVQRQVVARFSSPGLGEVSIVEPLPHILGKRYGTPDEEELADALKRFLQGVSHQSAERELHRLKTEKERKQKIFHRLINGVAV